jgi:predicted RND superfamily exporter protein
MLLRIRPYLIGLFALLAMASVYFSTRLTFSFSFDQFFPQDDPDLEFYQEFSKEFGTDDNFLLIGIENTPSVFDSAFLARVHEASIQLRAFPLVTKVQSLTMLELPVKTPFGYTPVPAIHLTSPALYEEDKRQIMQDKRWKYNLIDSAGTSMVIAATTKENITTEEAAQLVQHVDSLLHKNMLYDKAHVLGRAFFQKELIDFQKREIAMAFVASILLVSLIMVLLYRKPAGIIVSLGSIALGLLLFMGYLGAKGTELNALSALFPVIMLIVGSSDVIHIFSKYVDELTSGKDKIEAMAVTLREIGMATFMTSFTTAIGFATLATSRLHTIQQFGWDAAAGVLIAYVTVLFFTTSVLSYFDREQIIHTQSLEGRWEPLLAWIYRVNKERSRLLFGIAIVLTIFFLYGIRLIGTNYTIENNLPKASRVSKDFLFFEKNYAGFRPMEFAITVRPPYKADQFEVVREVARLEDKIQATPEIKSSLSIASVYKSMHMMHHGNDPAYYRMPDSLQEFTRYRQLVTRFMKEETSLFINADKSKTRITSRMQDVGADKVKSVGLSLDSFARTKLDTAMVTVRRTGTGIILDKNSDYITANLMQGLFLSIFIIGLSMGLLFRSLRMLVIALIPNVLPLLFAAAILGYFGIALEAGVAIMFTIIFGIAVDDTIHFLSRYKICRQRGMDVVTATRTTVMETGKAIIITSVILFFGFFNMIFSVSPPTFTVGILISVTLVSALICDLLLLPALLLRFDKK